MQLWMLYFALVGTIAAAPTTITLTPTVDTSLDCCFSGAYSISQTIRLYRWDSVFPILKFDISSIPSDASIISSSFTFTWQTVASDFNSPFAYVDLYDVQTDFTEDATFASTGLGTSWGKNVYSGADGLRRGVDYEVYFRTKIPQFYPYNTTLTFDTTTLLQSSKSQGKSWTGLRIGSFDLWGYIYSREASDVSLRPTLEITYSQSAPRAELPKHIVKTSDEWTLGTPVTVSSSSSYIPNGVSASYSWVLKDVPPGTSFKKGDNIGTSADLSFNPDAPGFYQIELTVANSANAGVEFSKATTELWVGLRTQHPRVHLSPSTLDRIQNGDHTTLTWTQTIAQADDPQSYWLYSYAEVYTKMVAYLATKDTKYCASTWTHMASIMFQDGVNPSSGYKTLAERYATGAPYYTDLHQVAFIGGFYIGNFAVAFDWGFDCFDSDQKQHILTWTTNEMIYNYLYNDYFKDYFRNDAVVLFDAVSRLLMATYAENPRTEQLIDIYLVSWRNIRDAWGFTGKGGASAEGNGYGASTAGYLIHGAHAVWTASGEDLFESIDFFKSRMMYDAFSAWPNPFGGPGAPIEYPGFPVPEVSMLGGDGRRSMSFTMWSMRPIGHILMERYPDSPAAAAFAYVFKEPQGWLNFIDALWPYPNPNPTPPATLSHFAETLGWVYARSDWTKDATWFAFNAGPHLDIHTHYDQGAFSIYKRRDLAIKAGNYDVGTPMMRHNLAFYSRTVGANTILIGAPGEAFKGFVQGIGCGADGSTLGGATMGYPSNQPDINNDYKCPPNDGGQRTMYPYPALVTTFEDYNYNIDVFESAKVVHFSDQDGILALSADITNSYNNPRYTTNPGFIKVTAVYRKVIYIRDLDLFLIGDIVAATNGQWEKKILVHALQSINIDKTATTEVTEELAGVTHYTNVKSATVIVDDSEPSNPDQITYDLRSGNASLMIETVFPKQFKYTLIGGRTPEQGHIADFWVKDYNEGLSPKFASLNHPPLEPQEIYTTVYGPTYVGGYGRFRLEVTSTTGEPTDYFLNMYRPTIDGVNNKMPAYTSFENEDVFGVKILDDQGNTAYKVSFPKKDTSAPYIGDPVPPSQSTPGTTPGKPVISGAASNSAVFSVLVVLISFLFF